MAEGNKAIVIDGIKCIPAPEELEEPEEEIDPFRPDHEATLDLVERIAEVYERKS